VFATCYRFRSAESGTSRGCFGLVHQVSRSFPVRLEAPNLNYYRHFPGDYLRDTMHLSAAEDGMYRRLLDLAYISERPLPLERPLLYAMVRANTKEDKKSVESVLRQYFKKTRYGFINGRVKKELVRTREISVKRASAGKQRTKQPANAQQMLSKRPQSLDSRLHTLDSIRAEEDIAAKATAAFQSIGFEHPFGHANFQAIWLDEYLNPKGRWVTQQMEAAIQRCQKEHIGVPPQFFEAKRDVETRENTTVKGRVPL
jgi:uncharacterized protein YdaU (DUF1376 family)